MDTNPTKLPEVGPLRSGKIDTSTTRCFDLFCAGKYKQGNDLKLNIQPADKIPSLITKDSNGDPVFAEPKPMCTIRSPKGHNVWIKIDLQAITTGVSNHIALGIKKQHENNYFDILYTRNLSRYVDVLETDTVELVPLVSSTPLSAKYTAVKVGDTAKITSENVYDFGSVYRVNVSIYDGQWITGQTCDLNGISSDWYNLGKIETGSIIDQSGDVHENQFLVMNYNGMLAHSADGKHWTRGASLGDKGWWAGPVYGNGIWCAICSEFAYGIKRSTDGGKNWLLTLSDINAECISFADSLFMVVTRSYPGIVYTSPDAEIWTQIGKVEISVGSVNFVSILIHGGGKWICGCLNGYVHWSKDGRGTWEQISDELHRVNVEDKVTDFWYGGCYANGYFYVIRRDGLIMRSLDGAKWERVLSFNVGSTRYHNITYYKNKLWAFAQNGQKYIVGLFNPNGTIESVE